MTKHMATMVTGLLTICLYISVVLTMPAPDEDRYFDKEYARELASWLGAISAQTNSIPIPCQPYVGGGAVGNTYKATGVPGTGNYYNNALNPYQKRNSELINSILSLPKNMNDAGK